MSVVLRAVIAIACGVLFLYVIRLVSKERLLLKYSLLWLVLCLLLMCSALFPGFAFHLSGLLGFETPANFIIIGGLFCLLVISLSLSVIVSKQTIKLKNIIQRQALLEYEIRSRSSSRGNQA